MIVVRVVVVTAVEKIHEFSLHRDPGIQITLIALECLSKGVRVGFEWVVAIETVLKLMLH